MSLTQKEIHALSTLQTIVATIQEVDELRSNNDRLVAQHIQDSDAIAILSDTKVSLEARIDELTAALAAANDTIHNLSDDKAILEASLRHEQELAGQHWNDLTITRDNLKQTSDDLSAVTFDRNRTAAKLTEAEDKLARFRDILGIPHPVESAPEPLPVPAPSPEPVVEVVGAPDSEAVTSDEIPLPDYPFTKEAETTVNPTSPDFDSQSGFYRYP